MGNSQLVLAMIGHFQTQAAADIAAIIKAADSADSIVIAKSAHSLKGAADYLAAQPLRHAAAKVERLARETPLSDIAPAIAELRRRLDECTAELALVRRRLQP